MNKGTFTGVGLGPGEPELITLKGYHALQAADIIFYPVTSLENGRQRSFSFEILKGLKIDTPCEPLFFPMEEEKTHKCYREAFNTIKEEYKNGKNVVLVSEGDILFYSTFGYIFKLAKEENIPCQLISGIPAFMAASCLGNQPLVEKTTGLEVMAKPNSFEAVTEALKKNSTLIIMKMSVLNGWHSFLKNCGRSFLYAERVGTAHEFFTSNAGELEYRKIPYFSLLIVYPEN